MTGAVEVRTLSPDPARRAAELEQAFEVRRIVFVDEQHVPIEEELDEKDEHADHLVAVAGERVVATCRLVRQDEKTIRLGRMAVLRESRGTGIAARLLELAEGRARAAGRTTITLDAQLTARGLYERAGYVAHGGTFLDAGIEHVAMDKRL